MFGIVIIAYFQLTIAASLILLSRRVQLGAQ